MGTTFAIQICLCVFVFLLFSYLRLAGWACRFYAPKRCNGMDEGAACCGPHHQ